MDALTYALHALAGGAVGYGIVMLGDYICDRWR